MSKSTDQSAKIFELPFDLLILIASHFNEKDLINFGMTCYAFSYISQREELWKNLYRIRFGSGKNSLRTNRVGFSWRNEYLNKTALRKSAANNMHIAHRNTYYWKIQSDPGSVYGRIASLNAVCRFLMYGYINAVPPGRYKVQWRMRVGIDSRINGNFKFSVSLEQIFNSSSFIYETYDMPEEFYLDPHIKGRGWVVLTMPGIVTVNPKDFDWVRLVSASNTSKCNNSRMYVKKDNDNIMVQVENDSMIGKPYYTKAEKRVSVELKKHIRNLTTKLRRIFQNTQA